MRDVEQLTLLPWPATRAETTPPKKQRSGHLHDAYCRRIVETNPNMLVPWYLMAAYAYYWADDPILTDGGYDALVRRLLTEWDGVEHWHKRLIDRAELTAGTCGLSLETFPARVVEATDRLMGRRRDA